MTNRGPIVHYEYVLRALSSTKKQPNKNLPSLTLKKIIRIYAFRAQGDVACLLRGQPWFQPSLCVWPPKYIFHLILCPESLNFFLFPQENSKETVFFLHCYHYPNILLQPPIKISSPLITHPNVNIIPFLGIAKTLMGSLHCQLLQWFFPTVFLF